MKLTKPEKEIDIKQVYLLAVAAAATARATTTARHVLRRKRGGIEKDFPGDSLKTRL